MWPFFLATFFYPAPAAWIVYAVAAAGGYLLGSIPTGYLVGKRYGIDIREHGSKSTGATNVVRVLGKKPGYFVFACDMLKGLLAVRLAMWWGYHNERSAAESLRLDAAFVDRAYGFGSPSAEAAAAHDAGRHVIAQAMTQNAAHAASIAVFVGIIAALACILGHNFPVWLRFRGGKGVATTVGVLVGLMPQACLVTAVVWFTAFYVWRYVSLASLLGAAILPAAVWYFSLRPGVVAGSGWSMFIFSLVAAALIFWRHRTNIGRLLDGTEARFAPKSRPPTPPPAAS